MLFVNFGIKQEPEFVALKFDNGSDNMELAFELLDGILADRSVPKNIRDVLAKVKEKAKQREEVSLAEAIYMMEELGEDLNLPEHTRTDIWQIISEFETEKERLKNSRQ